MRRTALWQASRSIPTQPGSGSPSYRLIWDGLASARASRHVHAMSVKEQAERLRDDFAFLGDWEARFQHLIDLGKALTPLAAGEYDDAYKVRGCSSQVWLVAEPSASRPAPFISAAHRTLLSSPDSLQ